MEKIFYRVEFREIGGGSRSEAERKAIGKLIRENFGEEARLEYDEFGAPILIGAGEPISISISHCLAGKGMIAALLAWRKGAERIGIDMEALQRASQIAKIAERINITPHWRSSGVALTSAWIIKEAIYKAAGMPHLTIGDIPLPSFEQMERLQRGEAIAHEAAGLHFAIKSLNLPDSQLLAAAALRLG